MSVLTAKGRGMTTKEYLNQIERCDRMIENKMYEISQLKSMATTITVIPKEINIQSFGDKDKIGSSVGKIVDLEREVDDLIDVLIEKKKLIVSQIDKIEDVSVYNLLTKRYVLRKTWLEISEDMGYSTRQVLRLHDKSTKMFEEMYGNTYKKLKLSRNVTKCH